MEIRHDNPGAGSKTVLVTGRGFVTYRCRSTAGKNTGTNIHLKIKCMGPFIHEKIHTRRVRIEPINDESQNVDNEFFLELDSARAWFILEKWDAS